MSHISKIDTKIKELKFLKKALESIQMNYLEAPQGQTLTLCEIGRAHV